MTLFALQYCIVSKQLTGIGLYLREPQEDVEDGEDTEDEELDQRVELGKHNVFEDSKQCKGEELPSTNITGVTMYAKDVKVKKGEDPRERISGIRMSYLDEKSQKLKSVTYGTTTSNSLDLDVLNGANQLMGVYGTLSDDGINSMGLLLYDFECKANMFKKEEEEKKKEEDEKKLVEEEQDIEIVIDEGPSSIKIVLIIIIIVAVIVVIASVIFLRK